MADPFSCKVNIIQEIRAATLKASEALKRNTFLKGDFYVVGKVGLS